MLSTFWGSSCYLKTFFMCASDPNNNNYHIPNFTLLVPLTIYIIRRSSTVYFMSATGMVSSAFLWGFLIDTLGRQQLLFYGLLFGAITEFSSGLVQRYWVLVVLKFFSGVMWVPIIRRLLRYGVIVIIS